MQVPTFFWWKKELLTGTLKHVSFSFSLPFPFCYSLLLWSHFILSRHVISHFSCLCLSEPYVSCYH